MAGDTRRKIVHVITGLTTGGAEMSLFRLLGRIDPLRFSSEVISLSDEGTLGSRIRSLGIPVVTLKLTPGRPSPAALLRLVRRLRASRPAVVQTWMYHADLLGGMAAWLAGGLPVAWGIHNWNLAPPATRRSTVVTARACAWSSRWLPDRIVCVSEASRQVHDAFGYASDKLVVIPNGFDLEAFKPDSRGRQELRGELLVPDTAPLIGRVGRYDLQKDYRNFVDAAARIHAGRPDAHFILCGDGIDWENRELAGWIDSAGLRERCRLLGPRDDVPRILAALDLACSPSLGEAFPLFVGEAMATGVPCVVTDVGDSARLVGETGRVVPPHDSEALARACLEMIELGPDRRQRLGSVARTRIEHKFSLARTVGRYQDLYEGLAS